MAGIAADDCIDPRLGDRLTDYVFGDLPEAEAEALERHVLECEACRSELPRLDRSVRILRALPEARPRLDPETIVSVVGLSGRLEDSFGGHGVYAIVVAVLFGLEWMVGLWSELGYSYNRFGWLAWTLSPPVTVWVTACVIAGLWTAARAAQTDSKSGLLRASLWVTASLAVLTALLVTILPAERTIQASFQTRTAAGGYLKDVALIFMPLLLFVIPPFHAVLAFQRELRAKRYHQVLGLLTRSAKAVAPKGVLYISPLMLVGVLALLGTLKVVGTNNMLDALTPGPYAQLFSNAAYISTAIWFAIPLVSLAWYRACLNELKRAALLFEALAQRPREGGIS